MDRTTPNEQQFDASPSSSHYDDNAGSSNHLYYYDVNVSSSNSQVAEDYTRLVGPTVEIEVTGFSNHDELQREILFDVNQKAGQFDGYILNPILMGDLMIQEGLWDLTDFVRNYQRNPRFWQDIFLFYRDVQSSYDNRIYLLPFDGDLLSLYYRSDLLAEHRLAPPVTWEEYTEIASYFHGQTVEQLNPTTGNLENVTLAGSCVARSPSCAGAYWTHLVLATMTQYQGTSTGSLLDTNDLKPLLGPAMEETLRILEEQASFGGDEFDGGCIEQQAIKFNRGECVLSYSWGSQFTQHIETGSVVKGKMGVAPTPGSTKVLDRGRNELVDCTPKLCPFSTHHTNRDGTQVYVNMAPYAAYGGWSGAVSNNVAPPRKQSAADFLAFASDTGKALKYVIPDARNRAPPTGQEPYRSSMLEVERWVEKGYPREPTLEYLDTIQQQLSSENVVGDMRFPMATSLLDALDKLTLEYLETVRAPDNATVDRTETRLSYTRAIHDEWERLIQVAEASLPVSILEIYQKSRGTFAPSDMMDSQSGKSIDMGVVATIAAGALVVVSVLTVSFFIRRELKRHQDAWYIRPEDITDTEEVLGQGTFGVVTKGFLRGTAVALKHPLEDRGLRGRDLIRQSSDVWLEEMSDGGRPLDSPSTHPLKRELATLVRLRHPNIVQTIGATMRNDKMILIMQLMQNNTIRSLLKDKSLLVGTAMMSLELQWALQVASAMSFLHSYPAPTGPLLHKDLKSSNVLVDDSFNALISDFGLATKAMKGLWGWLHHSSKRNFRPQGSQLWMAPEVLNGAHPSPASDVYSFGSFLYELMTRERPYGYRTIVDETDDPGGGSTVNPPDFATLSESTASTVPLHGIQILVQHNDGGSDHAWSGTRRRRRLSFTDSVSSTGDSRDDPIQDESLSRRLEHTPLHHPFRGRVMRGYVKGQAYTREEIIERVKDRSLDPPFRPDLPDSANKLLREICVECWHSNPNRRPTMREIEQRLQPGEYKESVTKQLLRRGSVFDSILPPEVQEKLSTGEPVAPVSYDEATVIFSDIVGFTSIASILTPEEVGDLINRLMNQFDSLCKIFGVRKLDVIGDAFLGVVGVPYKYKDHASKAADFALNAIEISQETLICPRRPDLGFVDVRFGIASGPVVATVIGNAEHPKYTLFGDTVNIASRMESTGLPNKCQCPEVTANLIRRDNPSIHVSERGTMNIKGKGEMTTFLLESASTLPLDDNAKYVQ